MSWDGVLVRFGEIGIKSAPVRRQMLQRLRQNLEDGLLRRRVEGHVAAHASRLWMTGPDTDALLDVAVHTFGVVSASPCMVVSSDMESMSRAAAELALQRDWTRFAVRANRSGEHRYTSQDMGIQIGSAVYKAAEAAGRPVEVDLTSPDLEVHVEARDDKAWLFVDRVAGPGGLPMGSQGKVVALISDAASGVAAWMMMRRGCHVLPVHAGDMGSQPLEVLQPLHVWGLPEESTLLPVCSGSLSKQTLLDAAAVIAEEANAQAIITGDTLRSTLLQTAMPVLRPVCGLASDEVDRLRQRIGVEDTGHDILDDGAKETVETLLSMRRVVS